MDFTDQTLLSPVQRLTGTGPIQNARVLEIARGLVGFFDKELKGSVPVYPEVELQGFAAAW